MTRSWGRRRRRAAVLAVLVVGAAAGCADESTEPPDAVDAARLAAVRADPALAGGLADPAATDTGSSNSGYLRAQVVLEPDGGTAATAAAVRAAGWRVTSVRCRPPVEAAPGPAQAVQAFKSMPAPAAGGGAYTVGLRIEDARVTAVIPYHLDPADPFGAPATDVPPAASCVETPTAPATAGQQVVIAAPAPRP